MIVWLDGDLVPLDTARISPLDHGFTVGDGVFETLRVYDGIPFAWRRHAARLGNSAAGLGLAVPDPGALREAADSVLTANELSDARLRITVTGGPAPPGSGRGDAGPTVVVVAAALEPREETAAVTVVPWTRNERSATAGLKTTSYAENVRALALARDRGCSEALFANTRGALCEGTGSNVFVVDGGRICTPPAAAGCLLGVSRALVLELAGELGIEAEERDLPPAALLGADEAFLTSTTREVQPIARVDGTTLRAPGPLTARLAAAFADLVRRDPDP